MPVQVYTDGACHGNGKAKNVGAYAFLILEDDQIIHTGGSKRYNTTNNQMELSAIIAALDWIIINKEEYLLDEVEVFSDSEYCVQGINVWIHSWIKSKFKKGKVKNENYWWKLHKLRQEFYKIKFKWVKGHSINKFNNHVDEMCNRFIAGT